MDDETFNKTLRSFLKRVGVNSQQEIEKAVRERVDDGRLQGNEQMTASVVLRVPELDLEVTIEDDLKLEE
jgi:hypothetical protein